MGTLRDGLEPHRRLFSHNLSDGIRKGKVFVLDSLPCWRPPWLSHGTVAAPVVIPALYSALVDQLDSCLVPGPYGNQFLELYQTTAQALPPSPHASKGLIISGDLVDNESVEYVPGGNSANNPLGYKAGTDPGILIRAELEIADVSGSDQLVIGVRKQEAYVVPTSFLSTGDALYTDFFGVGFSGSANPNIVKTVSDLNNAGSTVATSLAFEWSDSGIHRLELRIRARKPTVFINGVQAGGRVSKDATGAAITAQNTKTTPAFTFDKDDFLIPFLFVRHDTTAPGQIFLRKLLIAPLSEEGLDEASKAA